MVQRILFPKHQLSPKNTQKFTFLSDKMSFFFSTMLQIHLFFVPLHRFSRALARICLLIFPEENRQISPKWLIAIHLQRNQGAKSIEWAGENATNKHKFLNQ